MDLYDKLENFFDLQDLSSIDVLIDKNNKEI
jgi:hypothetical protein